MKIVAVTGSSGFIGQRLMPALAAAGWQARPAGHKPETWEPALKGAQAVIHLAARVHRIGETGTEADAACQRDNTELTMALAGAAAAAGVRRLVFLSSVKAMGEATPPGTRWDETAPCHPQDAYGRSKRKAEAALLTQLGVETVILRAPLVYGPGVKANMARLFKTVKRGLPLPLGGVDNARSLVYVDNLVDALILCLDHPAAAGETFLISDGEDVSTPELVRRIAKALGHTARLLPIPRTLLRAGAALAGRSSEADRLLGSLVVDSSKIRRLLGWAPPYSVDQGLRLTAESLRS